MIVYGPVPSRRLGHSLGINNIPPKTCTYSCVYCQLGRTGHLQCRRDEFYSPEEIFIETSQKLKQLRQADQPVDYLTLVPDGEPALDMHLGETIGMLKTSGVRVAVITNASLVWMQEVQDALCQADWVSLKVDAGDVDTWRHINRPHRLLEFELIRSGCLEFARRYKGTLVTETMLVDGINDGEESAASIGRYIKAVGPSRAYILIPTRPPAVKRVQPASIPMMQEAAAIIHQESGVTVEGITGDEGDDFFISDHFERDLLHILSVHPVRKETVFRLLKKQNRDAAILQNMLDGGLVRESIYEGTIFIRRSWQE